MSPRPTIDADLPQYNKNWYSSSDSLWFDRWQQAIELQPDFIEIITWNDYGESSYINEPSSAQVVQGAEKYVDGFDHSALRFVLPYFISAYKAGGIGGAGLDTEGAIAWYRTSAKNVCGDGGTVWGQGGSESATLGTEDVVSIIALAGSAPKVTVDIGGSSETAELVRSFGSAHFYQAQFGGKTGAVSINVNGKSTTGPEISGSCLASGNVNFNSVTIQI